MASEASDSTPGTAIISMPQSYKRQWRVPENPLRHKCGWGGSIPFLSSGLGCTKSYLIVFGTDVKFSCSSRYPFLMLVAHLICIIIRGDEKEI